tara:strand:- start:145 stop:513 length:369 start_codon:yes stop_codon:yes gene_type:complete
MKELVFCICFPLFSFGQIVTQDCSSIPDPGPCFGCGFIYWFNPTTSQCEETCWGLCDGLVPFWTLEDCQNSCENNFYIDEVNIKKNIIKTVDILGRESKRANFKIYIYNDGTIDKKYIINNN